MNFLSEVSNWVDADTSVFCELWADGDAFQPRGYKHLLFPSLSVLSGFVFLNKNLAMYNIKSDFLINLNTLEVHKPEN